MNKNEAIMKLFTSYLVDNDEKLKEVKINVNALKKGICINENCTDDIVNMACSLWGKDGFLLNQTFHKSFNTVLDTKEEKLFIQQLIHYITTYGFENLGIYNKNIVYIPRERLEITEIKSDIELIMINQITKEELKDRLLELCKSLVALSKETVEYVIELVEYMEITKDNIDTIKNKEIKTALYNKLNILPEEPDEFLRYFIYRLTGRTLLIKDKATISALEMCKKEDALSLLQKYNEYHDYKRLAEIFNRYKTLFVALKTSVNLEGAEEVDNSCGMCKKFINKLKNKQDTSESTVTELSDDERELNRVINKISHMSKKYHKPMKMNDLDMFARWCIVHENDSDFEQQIKDKIKMAGIWRAIKLKNYLQYEGLKLSQHVYKIRNGKAWICNKKKTSEYKFNNVIDILDKIIVERIRQNINGKKIYLGEEVDLVLPQSEKQFVGNIPFGSSISVEKENIIVGIQWFNVDNERVDLDLKIISNEYEIGWNADYSETDKLIFSGDVTDAPNPKGATECIYIDKGIGETLFSLKVNNYTCEVDNIHYDFIIAKGYKNKLKENYIIDPNDILIKIPKLKMEKGKAEHSIGTIIIDEKNIKLVLTDLCTSNRMVSENNEEEEILRKYIERESQSKCKLNEYLNKAGATIVNDKKLADIDLGIESLNKDTLVRLFENTVNSI